MSVFFVQYRVCNS